MKVSTSMGRPTALLTTVADTFLFFPFSSANVEALKEMLGETEGDVPVPVPR